MAQKEKKETINTLDEFAKAFFEDKKLFNDACKLMKAAINLTNAHGEVGGKHLKKIYNVEGEQK